MVTANNLHESLRFLTNGDLALLQEKAVRKGYGPDETILAEGSPRQALFLVHSGKVQVRKSFKARSLLIAELGPGEIFGEMSFVEHVEASASVIAADPSEVDIIESADMIALLTSVHGLSSRFYQSIAAKLSQRVRATLTISPME